MNITFVRHATAEDRKTASKDFDRALVDKGVKQTKRLQNFCQENSLIPELIFSSPYPRAMETANALADIPSTDANYQPPQSVGWLRQDANPIAACAHIKQMADNTPDLWLVGHEPHISGLITNLLCKQITCCGPENLNSSVLPMVHIKKASITRLKYDPDTGMSQLLWSVPCAFM